MKNQKSYLDEGDLKGYMFLANGYSITLYLFCELYMLCHILFQA